MDNLEWLRIVKMFDDEGMFKNYEIRNDVLEKIRKMSKEEYYKYRRLRALEIIAEELIKSNEVAK